MKQSRTSSSIGRYFGQCRTGVTECVDVYDEYLRATWPESVAVRQQRTNRWVPPYGPTPYYLPFWLTQAFPGVSPRQVRAVAVANVFLYHYYTLKDDIVDGATTGGLTSQEALIADAVFGEGLRHLAAAGATSVDFFSSLSSYMVRALRAESRLASDGPSRAFAAEEFRAMGQKAALAKVSAAAFASITGRRTILESLERGLDDMAVGMQLLDDLRDWKEDLEAGRFTYPLWLAHDVNGRWDAGSHIAKPEVAGRVLAEMEVYCLRAAETLQHVGATHISKFLGCMRVGASRVRRSIEAGRPSWPELERTIGVYLTGPGT